MIALPTFDWSCFRLPSAALTGLCATLEGRREARLSTAVRRLKEEEWQVFRLTDRHFRLLVYRSPEQRPPVLEEMLPDIDRLICSVAKHYSDASSPFLNYDDMVSEGRTKLVELLNAGQIQQQRTRKDFFKLLKTCLNNQARSKVQKYVYTEKRTGVKPPPRDQRFNPTGDTCEEVISQKHVELSLDDDDLHLQVGDTSADGREWQELVADYADQLSELEAVVFKQLVSPNEAALSYAYLDSFYGQQTGRVQIKIKPHHLALGLQITDELFREAVLSIRQKIQIYRSMSEDEQAERARWNATIAQLKLVFGVQIPPASDEMTIRRLFTIAARIQNSKVNEQVAEMLEAIGAKIPRLHKDLMSCYGVLYSETVRQCQCCGLKKSCYVEAANLGLNRITLSPLLLGARQTRTPVVLARTEDGDDVGVTFDEAEVLMYLEQYFARFRRGDDIYYGHNGEVAERQIMLFCLGAQTRPLLLKFCNPSNELKNLLQLRNKCYYPPDNATTQQVQELIERHAKEALEHAESA